MSFPGLFLECQWNPNLWDSVDQGQADTTAFQAFFPSILHLLVISHHMQQPDRAVPELHPEQVFSNAVLDLLLCTHEHRIEIFQKGHRTKIPWQIRSR